jgi:hypothetical protein
MAKARYLVRILRHRKCCNMRATCVAIHLSLAYIFAISYLKTGDYRLYYSKQKIYLSN